MTLNYDLSPFDILIYGGPQVSKSPGAYTGPDNIYASQVRSAV